MYAWFVPTYKPVILYQGTSAAGGHSFCSTTLERASLDKTAIIAAWKRDNECDNECDNERDNECDNECDNDGDNECDNECGTDGDTDGDNDGDNDGDYGATISRVVVWLGAKKCAINSAYKSVLSGTCLWFSEVHGEF